MSKFEKIFDYATNNKWFTFVILFSPLIIYLIYKLVRKIIQDKTPQSAAETVIEVEQLNFDSVADELQYNYSTPEWYLRQNPELLRQLCIKLYSLLYSNASSLQEYLFGNENNISAEYNVVAICEFIKSFQAQYKSGGVSLFVDVFKQLFGTSPRSYCLKMLSTEDYNQVATMMTPYAKYWL